MSAKSSNFAAEMIDTMTIEEMTHTAWRCRYATYIHKDEALRCGKLCKYVGDKDCAECTHFSPSSTAEAFFAKGGVAADGTRLTQTQRKTIAAIYRERVARGTY